MHIVFYVECTYYWTSFFLRSSTLQIELNAQSQQGEREDIVGSLKIAADPEFTFKVSWDGEWPKKCIKQP